MRKTGGRRTRPRRSVAALLAATALALVAALAAPVTARAAYRGFPDVNSDDWYVSELDYAVDHKLISGYADGRFAPTDPVSRGMVATILWRSAGEPKVDAPDFPDVNYGAFYGGAVEWARATGVISGYADGRFGPNDPVTREQLATMLMSYLTKVAGRSPLTPGWQDVDQKFSDAGSVSAFSRDPVAWAVGEGIISGDLSTGSPRINPQGSADRAQATKMLSVFHREVLNGAPDAWVPEGVDLADDVTIAAEESYELTGERSATIERSAVDELLPGDVVVLEPTGDNPSGTAIKLTRVSLRGDSYVVDGTEPSLDEVVNSLDVSGTTSRVVSVEPAPGVTMIDDATGRAVTMAGGSISLFDQTFEVDGVGKAKIRASVDYELDYDWGTLRMFDLSVNTEASIGAEVSTSFDRSIKLASARFATNVMGVAIDVDFYLTFSATGEVSMEVVASAEAGVRYEGGSWKTRGEKDLSFEASYSGEVRAGVEPTVVLNFCEIDVVDASVEVGGAIRGELLPRENGMLCCDLNAWMYVDLGVGQHDSTLAKLGLRKVFHIVDEGNSPKWSVHTEDGKVVPGCTWEEEPEVPAGYELLEKMPTTFVYSTGTWYNALYLQKDGTFDGILVDLNVGMTGEGYPNGSITLGEYYGGFEPPTQERPHEYRFEYKSLGNVRQPGTEQIVNGVRYYFTEPVGLTGGAITLLIYTPGATLSELPWGAEDWARYEGAFDSSGRLASYILYNPVQGTAFIGRPQWTDSIADIKAQNGIPF